MTRLATVPTLADVGADKDTFGPVRSVRHYPSAREWNNVKNAVVSAAEAIGTGPEEGSLAEVLSRGLASAIDATRWLVRDDFTPGISPRLLFTTRSGSVSSISALADASKEGFGTRFVELASAGSPALVTSGEVAAGGSALKVRARMRVTHTGAISNVTRAFVGLIDGDDRDVAVAVGITSDKVVARVSSTAGGGSLQVEGPTSALGVWYEIEVSVDPSGAVVLVVDGESYFGTITPSAVPTAAESMDIGYDLATTAGTMTLALDWVEAEGPRR